MSIHAEEIHNNHSSIDTSQTTATENKRDPKVDYSKLRVGLKSLEDATFNLGEYRRLNPNMTKEKIQQAIAKGDVPFMREASEFYFKQSGIYARLCKHLANFYRYDWQLIIQRLSPKIKGLDEFYQSLNYLDAFQAKRILGDIALKIMRQGVYYGYVMHNITKAPSIQELSPKYCRSLYSVFGRPAIEFNMKYFDDTYRDPNYRLRVLQAYPKDFMKGYLAYKEGRLPPQFAGDEPGWYLLDLNCTVKFNLNNEEYPPFISVIPHIIDLDGAQELERKRMAQKLIKIIIQKLPLDKNGELIFDPDEARDLHDNAVKMLSKAIGVDVLTTFADVDVADMADKASVAAVDELEKMERTVYNEAGTAQNLFNTDGNIALEKSILDDEANMYGLLLQFEDFLTFLIQPFVKNPKKLKMKVSMLPTTIYNYKELAKLYKEQAAIGGSKLLPMIALGQSHSSILATASFENEVLDVATLFSSQLDLQERAMKNQSAQEKKPEEDQSEKKVGRKEKPDDQKSEKTIRNKEAMS